MHDFRALVQSGTSPLPGAAIVALDADGAEVSSSSSEQNGSSCCGCAAPGTYTIRAALAAFAPATREATLDGRRLQRPDSTCR